MKEDKEDKMEEFKIYQCEEQEKCEQIVPNFIYNRYDLWDHAVFGDNVVLCCYEEKTVKVFFEVFLQKRTAKLGIYLMSLSEEVLGRIADFVFSNYKVSILTYENSYSKLGSYVEHNHLRIELPETAEELDSRLSAKGRYNIKREKRLIDEAFSGYQVIDLPAKDGKAVTLWEHYFQYKNHTHHTNYGLTVEEYCAKYHVTDVYALLLGKEERVASIVLSCEQCPLVYIENLTYDTELAGFSPGQILYDEYLKRLIDKGIKEIYLLGGNYSYKKRYASMEETVYNGTIYKNAGTETICKAKVLIRRCIGFAKRKLLRRKA